MKVTLDIKEDKLNFFMELVSNLKFVKVEKDTKAKKNQIINDLKEALEEVRLHKEGKIQLQDAMEFLNEI